MLLLKWVTDFAIFYVISGVAQQGGWQKTQNTIHVDGDICQLPVVLKTLWTPPFNRCHVPNYKAGPCSSSVMFMSFIYMYSFYTKLDTSLETGHGHPIVILSQHWRDDILYCSWQCFGKSSSHLQINLHGLLKNILGNNFD